MKKLLNISRSTNLLLKFNLKMKLSVLFIIASLFSMQAKETYGQGEKVTFNYENISLNQFIDEIENETDYRFVFKVDDVDLSRSFDIEVTNEPLDSVLNEIFKTTNTAFKIVKHRVYLIKRSNKPEAPKQILFDVQKNIIKGSVVDKNNIPLPGATILEVNSQNGASTDFNGNFSLTLKNLPTTIKASFIGYKTQER